MNNRIIKTLAYQKQVRIIFLDNTELLRLVCHKSDFNRLLRDALGQTLTLASLASGFLKEEQQLSIKIKGERPAIAIFADADWAGNLRGYVGEELLDSSLEEADSSTIMQLLGERCCMQVVKDIGMDIAFTGITDMPYSKLSDNFAHYFHQSEQIPSFFWSLILFNEENEVVRSIGIAAQLLPGASLSILRHIKKAVIEKEQQASAPLNDEAIEALPKLLFEDIEVMSTNTLQLNCECSKPMFYPMLYSLGIAELKEAAENNQSMEFVCHACGRTYSFSPEEIAGLVS